MIIKNAKVFTDGCRFVEKDLVIRDGRIVFGAAPQENEEGLDAKGSYSGLRTLNKVSTSRFITLSTTSSRSIRCA